MPEASRSDLRYDPTSVPIPRTLDDSIAAADMPQSITDIPEPAADRIAFGPFVCAPRERLLLKDGVPVEIGGRSLDLLLVLIERPGHVIHRRELLKRVWPDVVVEDGSLRFHMTNLRKVLGDGVDGARYVATQVGVGYAFVAPVRSLPDEPAQYSDTAAPPTPPPARLPPRPPHVIGRESDVQLLGERLVDIPLFTIVGPGGVGKTTLAVEAAHEALHRFADGAGFVDLATLENPALIPSAIAGALGISVQGDDPLTVVLSHIRSRRLLLILDNCEHLVEGVAQIVDRIRETAPHVSILATSRETLRVAREHVHWLAPLGYPVDSAGLTLEQLLEYPAIQLFVERAAAGNSTFVIDFDSARRIADMCRQLDGMALPIELTAVRVATHGLLATSQLLDQRLSLHWTGRRTSTPRHQTLQATLDWSYDLLSPAEQLVLDRLSIFLGLFSLNAALAVAIDEAIDAETATAALEELTAKSLLAPDRSISSSCYRLLEMTRTYARKKLLARGVDEYNATSQRHAGYILQVLENRSTSSHDFQTDARRFSLMLGNVRTALEWSHGPTGDLSIGVPLAAASTRVFMTLSLLIECRSWSERAVSQLGDRFAGTSVELELQAALGLSLMFTRGNSEASEKALRRALDIATALDDRWNQLRLLGRLHIFHERIGDFATASAWADRAVRVADEIDEPEAIAVAASLAGISHHLAGDQTLARHELERSLREGLRSDRSRTVHYGFDHRNRSGIALARVLWLLGQADFSRHVTSHIVQEAARLDHPVTHCIALVWTLSIHLWTGDLDQAQASLDTFAQNAEMNAFGPYIAASAGFRGQLGIQRGQPEGALCLLEESLSRLHSARYELLTSTFEAALVEGMILRGRCDQALDVANIAIDRCNDNGEQYMMPELLRLKAISLHRLGRPLADVEALFQASIDCARRQGARSWELRGAMDLARLRIEDGRTTEALALLDPVRNAFVEGLDTMDLRTADALLQRLLADTSTQKPALG